MDSSIGRIAAGARYVARPVSDKERKNERDFVLPEEGEEGDVVLEPKPRRDLGGLTISRERLEDEAGHNIDVRG